MLTDRERRDTKTLTTAEAARALGLQPDDLRTLAFAVGLPTQGKRDSWSEADVAALKSLLEVRR